MNLSEDKKTPLRDKDLNKKREMVIQYISTASKTVSVFWEGFHSCLGIDGTFSIYLV